MLKKIKAILTQDLFSSDNNTSESSGTEIIPENSVSIHNQALLEIKMLSSIAKTLDRDDFQQPDFMFYLDIKSSFIRDIDQYKGLQNSAELLEVAIAAQSIFLRIEQIELRYHSSKQQEYYDYVMGLLDEQFAEEKKPEAGEEEGFLKGKKVQSKKVYSPNEFREKIETKLAEIRKTIKSEQGQIALDDYAESLKLLAAKKELGLKLLYLFKQSNLKDLSILKSLSDMVNYLQDKNLKNTKAVMDLVDKNQDIFRQVTRIIGLSKSKETLETYATLLQYLALSKKHEENSQQFFRLMAVMKEWLSLNKVITNNRQDYPGSRYNLPEEYKAKIPGVSTYETYEDYIELFGTN